VLKLEDSELARNRMSVLACLLANLVKRMKKKDGLQIALRAACRLKSQLAGALSVITTTAALNAGELYHTQ
jgi:hypothetical protein